MIVIRKRRRQEGRTDYAARKKMLNSEEGRIIFRKTNKYILGQYILSEEAKDKTDIGLDSRALLSFGWPNNMCGSLKSLPAAYLTGFLLGKKVIEKKGKTKAVFDIGLQRSVSKSRMYSFLKGVIDAGVEIKAGKEVFPDDSRISGKNIKSKIEFEKIKERIKND